MLFSVSYFSQYILCLVSIYVYDRIEIKLILCGLRNKMESDSDRSSESEEYLLSGSEVDEDEVDGEEAIFGTEPYLFEPRRSPQPVQDTEDVVPDVVTPADSRLGNTDWCNCGKCVQMPRTTDCICCKEMPVIKDNMFEGKINIFSLF